MTSHAPVPLRIIAVQYTDPRTGTRKCIDFDKLRAQRMAAGKLIVDADQRGFYLAWHIPDDDFSDVGAALGEHRAAKEPKPGDKYFTEQWAVWLAEKMARELEPKPTLHDGIYYWKSRRDAAKVCRTINAALKFPPERPMPLWASKALAEGWKPPKGWKP